MVGSLSNSAYVLPVSGGGGGSGGVNAPDSFSPAYPGLGRIHNHQMSNQGGVPTVHCDAETRLALMSAVVLTIWMYIYTV